MSEYFYSEKEPPFPHQIRCVPDDLDHDEGIAWLKGIDDTLAFLGLQTDIDYTKMCMTIIRFRDYDTAANVYNALELGFGENLAMLESSDGGFQ